MDHDQSQNDEARHPSWAPITGIPFPPGVPAQQPGHPRDFTVAEAVIPSSARHGLSDGLLLKCTYLESQHTS